MFRSKIAFVLSFLLLAFSFQVIGQGNYSALGQASLYVGQPVVPGFSFPDTINPNGRSSGLTYAQTENYSYLTPLPTYDKRIAGNTVPVAFTSNPDFGILPLGTTCKDCYEEIQKRTSFSRYFKDLKDTGTFYIQQSNAPVNFFKNGYWLSINPRLNKINDGQYAALQQPLPAILDIIEQRTILGEGNTAIGFNHFTMIEYDLSGNPLTYQANWQNYSVGDNGIYVHDVFPGIDLTVQFLEKAVKSNLLIQHGRSNSSKIIFSDSLQLPPGFTVTTDHGQLEDRGWNGDLTINDGNGHSQFTYGNITIASAGAVDKNWHGNYSLAGNKIQMNIYSDTYNDPDVIYPLSIDPLVTYGPFNSVANPIGAGVTPAFCSNSIVVPVPGQATYTDFSATWSVTNTNSCGCSNALFFYGPCGCFTRLCHALFDQLYITSSCGGASPSNAPTSVWTCPGCNGYGTWAPTIAFGSGETAPATCITPSCFTQNVTFTVFLNQFACGNANCGSCTYATNTCAHLNSWSVTLQGHTLEHPNAPTSSSGTVFCLGNCTNLTATGQYGVPPYTYLWNPGGVTTNPYMNVCPAATTTYTCTITDACGNTGANQVTIVISGCLPLELLSFTAFEELSSVKLNWSTATETNTDHFLLERSTDAIHFIPIATIAAAGNSTEKIDYQYYDEDNPLGVVYYRLKFFDQNGASNYSIIVAVNITDKSKLFVRPNPVKNSAEIGFACDEGGIALITIYNELSQEVFSKKLSCVSGRNIEVVDLGALTKGIYFVKVKMGDQELKKRFLKE